MPSRAKSYVHVGSFFAGSICGLGGFGVGFCFSKELLRSTGIFILNSNLRLFDLRGFILRDLPLVLWCFHFYIELYSWDVTVAHSHHDIHPWMCIGVCNIRGYRVHTLHTCRVETHSERLHAAYVHKRCTKRGHKMMAPTADCQKYFVYREELALSLSPSQTTTTRIASSQENTTLTNPHSSRLTRSSLNPSA